jgi:hypothetical protein
MFILDIDFQGLSCKIYIRHSTYCDSFSFRDHAAQQSQLPIILPHFISTLLINMQAIVASRDDGQVAVRLDKSHNLGTASSEKIHVKVLASPIDVSDVGNVLGWFPKTTFPRVPGRDFAGLVTAPSSHPLFQKFVYGTSGSVFSFTEDGAHAEYISIPSEGVAEIPSGVDVKTASIMGTLMDNSLPELRKGKSSGW